jgi:predicted HNH restriction endonuclease
VSQGNHYAAYLDYRWEQNQKAAARRLALKERAIAHLGGKCQICGYDKCPSAFDFHHLDDAEKEFVISSKASWATIEPELAKCTLLCATCHREVHAGWHPEYLALDEPGQGYIDDPFEPAVPDEDWDALGE